VSPTAAEVADAAHDMQSPPRSRSPVRALQDAETSLAKAKEDAAKAAALVATREREVEAKKIIVEAAKRSALISVRPRSLLKAYALWLLFPLVWPGAYLFYLGRDTHAYLHTISFGGFGIGWLLDFFYIPLYVADHNEPDGYLEGVEQRHRRWFSLSLLLMPFRLLLTLVFGLYAGLVGAYLVPNPVVLPPPLAELLGLDPSEPLSRSNSAAVGFCVGMQCVGVAVQLSHMRLGRTRTAASHWKVAVWTAVWSALLAPHSLEMADSADGSHHAPGLVLGAASVMLAASAGRSTSLAITPHRNTQRGLSARLVVQLVGVSAFAAAALGAFYLNGSFTHTDPDTGETVTYTGPEALAHGWKQLGAFSGELSTLGPRKRTHLTALPSPRTRTASRVHARLQLRTPPHPPRALCVCARARALPTCCAAQGMWQRQKGKSWTEMWIELRAAFRDPSIEAREVLGVEREAGPDEIKQAYRKLARLHHPDKVEPTMQAEAKQQMARINWAKEVLLKN